MGVEKKGKNAANLQDSNLRLLLELLRTHEGMSRQDLVDKTSLSASGISKLVAFLIEKGMVVEDLPIARNKGRRAISLKLSNSICVIGVRLARNYIKCGLFSLKGDLLFDEYQETSSKLLAETTEALMELIGSALEKATKKGASVYGIGISAPGPLFSSDGRLVLTSNYPEWQGFSVKKFVEEQFGLPTIVEHDANVSVLAEKWYGKGKNCTNLIYVVADRGVGAGVYTNDEVYTGHQNIAGEIGHTTIDYNGDKCECGNRGCLEMFCSSTAVLKEARQIWETKAPSGWQEKMTIDKLGELAAGGDIYAQRLLVKTGTFLGIGLVNLINTYNPAMIIVGDEMTRAGMVWFDAVKDAVRKRSLEEVYKGTVIEMSELPIEPAFLGTGTLVTTRLFESISSVEFQMAR